MICFLCNAGFVLAQDFRLIETDTIKGVRKYDLGIKEPLYILNGKRIDSKLVENINPQHIAHIEVVKPPQSLEKYGEQGKNGVIILTLKQELNPKKN
jgi:hypothetical protein